MDKNTTSLYVMNLCENGQNIYVDQSDPTRGFIFDEEGNLRDFSTEQLTKSENMELQESNDDSDDISESIPADLEDTSHLGIINGLDEGQNFEDSLMRELDTGIMNLDTEEDGNCIMQHMDIREPLSTLKSLLEQRLNLDLNQYKFYLQETQLLESHKNLVDQCVQGEGLVQINVLIQNELKRINIVDVLKPAEDYMDLEEEKTVKKIKLEEKPQPEPKKSPDKDRKVVTQWQIDLNFKSDQERLKIPSDPKKWSVVHVRHWVQWAVRQFNLPFIKLSDWTMTGEELFKLSIMDFQKKVPKDPGDVFWTHFELLRQMKVVACKKVDKIQKKVNKPIKPPNKANKIFVGYPTSLRYIDRDASRSCYNGQVQLWQFLLELLTCPDYKSIIQWIGNEGEFKLCQPEHVAKLWGERKNKSTMNYEKLSRALRYYYDGDMIAKVHGKRFVYKFVCDLKQLIGYSAVELSNLISTGNPFVEKS